VVSQAAQDCTEGLWWHRGGHPLGNGAAFAQINEEWWRMASINQFIIDGNLTRDVDLRQTSGGTAVAFYVVAVDREFNGKDGKADEADYIPVTTYGRQAENDAKYLRKGHGVTVMGRIKSWSSSATGKRGFDFEAERVVYRGRPASTPKSVDAAPEDQWLRDYDQVEPAPGTSQVRGTGPGRCGAGES
jgi:single-strand DNA-binding protein